MKIAMPNAIALTPLSRGSITAVDGTNFPALARSESTQPLIHDIEMQAGSQARPKAISYAASVLADAARSAKQKVTGANGGFNYTQRPLLIAAAGIAALVGAAVVATGVMHAQPSMQQYEQDTGWTKRQVPASQTSKAMALKVPSFDAATAEMLIGARVLGER